MNVEEPKAAEPVKILSETGTKNILKNQMDSTINSFIKIFFEYRWKFHQE
jgi:hypothetical protein